MEIIMIFLPGLVGMFAFLYLGMPLFIKFSNKIKGAPHVERIDPSTWPDNITATMRQNEHDLYNMGFEIAERFSMVGATSNTANLLTMFIDRKSGDKAMLTAIWVNANGIWKLTTIYLEFSTRFRDGRCFDTLNAKTPIGTFIAGPNDVKTQVPQVTEARELYQVHLYVMRKHGATGSAGDKVGYPPGGAQNYLMRMWRESHEEQVKFGRLQYNQKSDLFTPTFVGAYLMSWRHLWPVTLIYRARMNREAEAIVAEMRQSGGQTNESALAGNPVL